MCWCLRHILWKFWKKLWVVKCLQRPGAIVWYRNETFQLWRNLSINLTQILLLARARASLLLHLTRKISIRYQSNLFYVLLYGSQPLFAFHEMWNMKYFFSKFFIKCSDTISGNLRETAIYHLFLLPSGYCSNSITFTFTKRFTKFDKKTLACRGTVYFTLLLW